MEVLQFLRDEEAVQPTMTTVSEAPESLREREEKCRKKMASDPPYSQSGLLKFSLIRPINQLFYLRFSAVVGLHCGRHWDGQLCWDDTPAGSTAFHERRDSSEAAGEKTNIV